MFFVVIAESMISIRHTRFYNPWLELVILIIAVIHLWPTVRVFSTHCRLMKVAFGGWFIYLGVALIVSFASIFGKLID